MTDSGYDIYPSNESPAHHNSILPGAPKAWHPKITPYRLVVLITTIGLGTAKAVVTQKGGTIVSTTLEWVAGTFLSVIFFALSAYESQEDHVPSYLSWLFKSDCMELVWTILALFSIKRPEYVSDEVPSDSNVYLSSANPDVTPYRILVCSAVTAFGLSKAMLGYANQSAAATWTDWAVAVPVTTTLYILGLYEYNSSNISPGFFNRDHSDILYSVNRGMMYSVGITLASAWTAFWAYILYQFTVDPQYDLGSLPADRSHLTLEAYFDSWQAVSAKLWLQECFVAAIALGSLILFLLLRPTANAIIAVLVMLRKILRVIRRPIFRVLRPILPPMANDALQTSRGTNISWETTKSYLRIAFHVVLHMSGVIFMLTVSMVGILAGVVTLFQHSWKEPVVFFVMPMWAILGLMMPWAAYNCWKSMIADMPSILP